MTPAPKAGRELDALVAEKVMGWRADGIGDDGYFWKGAGSDGWHSDNWKPSTDIAAAWAVVEKMATAEDEFRLAKFKDNPWGCTFRYFEGDRSSGDTAPEAICLAALAALKSAGAP